MEAPADHLRPRAVGSTIGRIDAVVWVGAQTFALDGQLRCRVPVLGQIATAGKLSEIQVAALRHAMVSVLSGAVERSIGRGAAAPAGPVARCWPTGACLGCLSSRYAHLR